MPYLFLADFRKSALRSWKIDGNEWLERNLRFFPGAVVSPEKRHLLPLWKLFDRRFGARSAGAVGVGAPAEQPAGRIGARVSGAASGRMGRVAGGQGVADAGVPGAVDALDQIQTPLAGLGPWHVVRIGKRAGRGWGHAAQCRTPPPRLGHGGDVDRSEEHT